jgi:hypothetical protein
MCCDNYNWKTGKVFTKAPAFGEGAEVEELKIVDIRPTETDKEALIRQGFNPKESRIEYILF